MEKMNIFKSPVKSIIMNINDMHQNKIFLMKSIFFHIFLVLFEADTGTCQKDVQTQENHGFLRSVYKML